MIICIMKTMSSLLIYNKTRGYVGLNTTISMWRVKADLY